MNSQKADRIRAAVRDRYGTLGGRTPARASLLPMFRRRDERPALTSCCSTDSSASCCEDDGPCGCSGYSTADLAGLPAGSNLGLGCGNPTALGALQPGETVLDLGSGGGVDCFLAARKVGPAGHVIGVDMTPEMVARSRANARRGNFPNVEFRLGEVEHLPVADRSVDVVLSNCVINLVPDKSQVYREAFRVLRPGGRLAVADMIATRPIPAAARRDPSRWTTCSSGALSVDEIDGLLAAAGFDRRSVEPAGAPPSTAETKSGDDLGVVPGTVRAVRPGGSPGAGSTTGPRSSRSPKSSSRPSKR